MKAKQAGFTLVEIAIVLVIIGLLLGGVLKGQELITQAKIKNIAADMNGVAAAVYAYQDRYKAYPGEDQGAARWGVAATVSAAATGGGNGQIDGFFDSATATDESLIFWEHIRRAGLISGDPAAGRPQNPVGGFMGVQTGAPEMAGLVICVSGLPGKIAGALDSQFDDGNPEQGTVQGFLSAANAHGTPATTNAIGQSVYADDATTLYIICKPI
jgi:prepilin-type N-terminal cleavage/methylation domain-containing protein